MSAKVVPFPGPRRLNVAGVIQAAAEAGLSEVIILGRDKDGEEWFKSSIADGGDVLWLLGRLKLQLLSGCFND